MRRGLLCVEKTAGQLSGWEMRAGTIVILGPCQGQFGAGMRRGTIVLASARHSAEYMSQIMPTFRPAGRIDSVILNILSSSLAAHGVPRIGEIAQFSFQMFSGDHLSGGRGELLIAT
jgi:formylmethanofuran dehydrogenase subunit C